MTVPADDAACLARHRQAAAPVQAGIERPGVGRVARGVSAAHAPSSIPLRTGTVPVTRPSGAPVVTKRIARRM